MLQRHDIRRVEWYIEISEFLGVEPELVSASVPESRMPAGDLPEALLKARENLRQRFMSQESRRMHDRICNDAPQSIEDKERSASWRDYIFVCINGERRSFQRLAFYEKVIRGVVEPLLSSRGALTCVDYGCGSSLFTRIVSQDCGRRTKTISVDVCRPAVEFAVSRNRLHNERAEGYLLQDVMDVVNFRGVDLILAYAVFEHLPNSSAQIRGLIDSLGAGGVLIENYSGHSSEVPHKSDTFDSYKCRDRNLDMLRDSLLLLHGKMPRRRNGVYDRDIGTRYWIAPGAKKSEIRQMRRLLSGRLPSAMRLWRKFASWHKDK